MRKAGSGGFRYRPFPFPRIAQASVAENIEPLMPSAAISRTI
jgi:hypothetical protein